MVPLGDASCDWRRKFTRVYEGRAGQNILWRDKGTCAAQSASKKDMSVSKASAASPWRGASASACCSWDRSQLESSTFFLLSQEDNDRRQGVAIKPTECIQAGIDLALTNLLATPRKAIRGSHESCVEQSGLLQQQFGRQEMAMQLCCSVS